MDEIFTAYDKIKELMIKSGRDIEQATLKLVEELGEFVSVNFGLKSYKKSKPVHLQEEVVDLLQCAIGIYVLVQEKYPFDGKAIIDKKNEKWENKYIKENK